MNELNLVEENYNIWTNFPFDKKTISKVKDLKKNNIEDFNDSFYSDLSFGTGGMRGFNNEWMTITGGGVGPCLLYTSPSPRDRG
mgnify:CR=1 FL=1